MFNNKITRFLFLCAFALTAPATWALGDPAYVTSAPQAGSLELVGPKSVAAIYVDNGDHKGLRRAVADLQSDIETVTGRRPQIVHSTEAVTGHAVIIGTIGRSALLDQLIESGKLDPGAVAGQWEGYHIETLDNPLPGIERALVIAGADKRGAIYGSYDLSEQIGVSPWHWWADVPADKKDRLYVAANTRLQDAPKVQYRGIFLNDEAPALTGWATEKFGGFNHQSYEHVFELLLRLKANYLWPAMWNNAFADDDPQNMILADEYGIVMGTSHHEPMMRADKEWNRYGKGPWEYSTNRENLRKFWQEGARRNKNYESLWTLGMRGQADTPMSEGENIGLLEKIVSDQRDILEQAFGDASAVPQVWALYKEVQGFYEKGMRVPDDVTLLWSDDNWGNLRRLPTPEERGRKGGAGIYYHFDYVGGPRSYRWINTVPIAKVWEQMNLAYAYEANRIWITNVGDLKPMEFPIEFFLRLAWNPERWPKERLVEYGQLWAAREFGPEHAADIEQLVTGYTRHNGRRKPEQVAPETYSLIHYREAERIEAELDGLVEIAEDLYRKMPAEKRDAFYQLVLYPIKASATVTKLNIATARNRLYASQGRADAEQYAEQARRLFAQDAALEREYHEEIAGGKWNHMMSQPRIGYTNWNNPAANTIPILYSYRPNSGADMGVAVEGMEAAWPESSANSWPHDGSFQMPAFDPFGKQSRTIEIYNRGTQPFTYRAEPSDDWIRLSERSGEVKVQRELQVRIDWSRVPEGRSEGSVHISGTGYGGARIKVFAHKPEAALMSLAREAGGFVEADGYISMEAASYSDKGAASGIEWQEIPNHGRTRSSVTVLPASDTRFQTPQKAPWLEYEVFFTSAGEFEVSAYFAPTLNVQPGHGLRYALAFDDEKPRVVDILENFDSARWEEAVSNGVHLSKSRHTVTRPGPRKLRIYALDPALTLQKIVIDTGGLRPSYLGPPESARL